MKQLLLATLLLSTACGVTASGTGGGSGGAGGGSGVGGGGGSGVGGGSSVGGGSGGTGGGNADAGVFTWYRDVLPLVQDHCQACHTTGGIGSFPMLTYAQVAPTWYSSMALQTGSKRMPPWMPTEGVGFPPLNDSRSLTPAQINVFAQWSADGAPEGNPADAPPPRDAGTGLPWVDATLDQGFDYTPTAGLTDDYHCFVIDPKLTANQDVIGFDINPKVRAEVHHIILYTATTAEAAAQNTTGTGWTCFGGPGTGGTPQMLGGWVPGTPVTQYPATTGVPLTTGRVIVMQVHYNNKNGFSPDRSVVKLQYSKSPVAKPATILPLLDDKFLIPPNSVGYTHGNSFSTPLGAKIWGVLPHMHTLGKRIKVDLNGTTLIDISKWDFHWQQMYFFTTPIQVSPGGTLNLNCTWDNPGAGMVKWGEKTSDEMCLNYFYATF